MPELKTNSKLMPYKRRFEYLLINVPAIHQPEKAAERTTIFSLYPDEAKLRKSYLQKYIEDLKLTAYFNETYQAIRHPNSAAIRQYTTDELMEVASKFFYCDLVNPDTTVQAHVCIGLNGIKEARWTKDCTLLEAFCYEAIFTDFEKENSPIWEAFVSEKNMACMKYRTAITSLDQYLEDVKQALFAGMKNNPVLRKVLLDYYDLNKSNLAFGIGK